jgi:RNA polymerase-binding transcription factor DksA
MRRRKKGVRTPARGKVSIDEILGDRNGDSKPPAKWAEHYGRLAALRDHFLAQKAIRAQDTRVELSTHGEHIAEAASDSYERDWDLALASSDQNSLYEIQQALDRIARGVYGRCELTGKPIESARLRAVPWTRFSAAAQSELEARGAAKRIQLGALGDYFNAESADQSDDDDAAEPAPPRLKEAA